MLSYLDVVIQGFIHMHGERGAEEFFATTDGWDTPVKDDRAAPIYPRHQKLTLRERQAVDAGLRALSAVIV